MLTFRNSYFILTVMLFAVEVLIALFLHDGFIRPYVGDFLVVILLYCFFRTFLKASVFNLGLVVLVISYAVETLQYFKIVKLLGLQKSKLANIVIGNSFEWFDLVAYTLGIAVVLVIENLIDNSKYSLNRILTRNK